MKLRNEFRVPVPVEDAFAVLTDLERIAPCMPGAALEEVAGDEYRGVVKVKVGPITAQYRGSAAIAERDESAHRAVRRASGRDTRGQGNANATVVAALEPDGDGTRVLIETDLQLTGKVAQFGRGVLADVSTKLLAQFAERLEADVLAGRAQASARASSTGAGGGADGTPGSAVSGRLVRGDQVAPRRLAPRDIEPVDLLGTAGAPVLKRVLPLLVVLVVVALVAKAKRSAAGTHR